MRKIDKIVVHCTASPDYMDIGTSTIRKWHKDRGWSDIGYHYVIRRNGEIEKGRPDVRIGAHARGANSSSIGIVWVGTNQPSPEQEKSLFSLIHFLMGKYSVKIDNVLGHREAVKTSKTCPNLNMDRVRAELIFVQPVPKVR
jgi:N-acetylmuramoyl-L-alanine amidase